MFSFLFMSSPQIAYPAIVKDFSRYRVIIQVKSILSGIIMDDFISREIVGTIKLKRRHLEGFKLDPSM